MPKRAKKRMQQGFSLVEMMISIAILTLVVGVVVGAVNTTQQRSNSEIAHLDITQQAREMIDQFVRDLHQAGFPPSNTYATQPASNRSLAAMKLVAVSQTDIWFEGDV